MSLSEHLIESTHPIDIVETLAEDYDWEFDRVGEDQIAMAVEGQWRTYSITLAWSGRDETLRMIASFDLDPPADRLPEIYELVNLANDGCWTGAFAYWAEQKLMVYRYGLLLSGGQTATTDQIDMLIAAAVMAAERYYPAFQLAGWGSTAPAEAIKVAIAEAYGRA
ncbi:MAG: YbjN domain-containing protein [Rhodobacteraceae bacterium]|nr:YbjN domain-containing protein [Paracoccaceae bacterium]